MSDSDDGATRRTRSSTRTRSDTRATAGMTVGELVEGYGDAGIGAASVNEAGDVLAEMFANDDCTVFLAGGRDGARGMRRIVSDLIRDGYVDALVTTGANLTHDAIEAIGGNTTTVGPTTPRRVSASTTRGSATRASTASTTSTSRRSISRPSRVTCARRCSRRSKPIRTTTETAPSASQIHTRARRANAAVNERDDVVEDAGVAAAAYECDVPVYRPAVQDSVLGLQAWMYAQTADFTLDALDDMTELTDLAFDADDAGCLLVGGGVPKNFTLQTMLVTPRAYDYAVQITMDPEATGGLSGATLEEARSGKLEKDARNASVYGDATVMLPMMLIAAARERVE